MAAWRDQGPEGTGPHGDAPPSGSEGPGRRDHVAVVEDDPDRLHWGRGALLGVILILSLIAIALGAVYVLSSTDWGRERVRRFAERSLNGMIHGHATIGRLSGNLLTGFTAHDVVITDSAGKPFIAVESVRSDYSIVSLWRKHIWLDDVELVRPLIVLDRPPNGKWNWQRIFPRDTTPKPASQQKGWGDWIRLTDVSVVNGQVIVRTPWHPSEGLKTQAARDSAVRSALSGDSRLIITRVPGGFQKRVQLDSVMAKIPFLRLADPNQKNRLAEVTSLSMKAYPFRPPAADVRDLKGLFPFNNDSLWWSSAYVELPHSKASGSGRYVFSTGDMTLHVHSDPASFADMRWVYPRLPDGHGKLDLALTWHGALQDYAFTNTDITMGQAHASGSFGITLGDTLTLHDTNLRFAGFDTRTLEQLIPGFHAPRRGVFSGRAAVSGGVHAMRVDADVTFDDVRAGRSRVTAVGEAGKLDNGGVQARNLRLGMFPLQVDMVHTWMPDLPVRGLLTGTATVSGSTNTRLEGTLDVRLADRGTESAVTGKALVTLTGAKHFDVDVTAHPISLVEVGRFVPSAGLQGTASGPIHVTGTLSNLRLAADLRLPENGRLTTRGTLDLASKAKGYDLTATLATVNLRTVTSKAPVTSLTAHVMVRGTGTTLPTMNTVIAADLSTSRWDSFAVDTVSVRATLANGLAVIPKLYAQGAHATANVHGAFGLTRDHAGTLTYNVAIDSLGAFNRWIPKSSSSPKAIAPRPGRVARAVRQAKADSARIDRQTEMARMISGAPGPTLDVHAPQPVPADTLAGAAYASGTLSGNIYDFDLNGAAGGENVTARGNFVRRFRSLYRWTDARTPQSKLAFAFDADSVSAMGFGFDTVSARLTYANSGGHVELAITQDDQRQYGANGDYVLHPDRNELRLADMTFRFDTAYWSMPHPSTIRWGGPGIRVTDFELHDRGNGRIYANGLLPTDGVADFVLDVDNFPLSNVTDITQTDIDLGGILTLHGSMTGTLSNPAFRGAFGVVQGVYNGTQVPELLGRFGYADRQLVTHVDMVRAVGQSLATVDARLPVNLAFTGVTGSRLLPEPMSVDLVADSLPLDLVPQFTDLVSQVKGRAAGKVVMRGTLKNPTLVGGLTIIDAAATINATGAAFTNIGSTVRMVNDTVYVDSLVGNAKGPVRVRGTIGVADLSNPVFALYLTSSGAELMNNDLAKIRVDAGLALTGPYDDAYVSGAATITQGIIYAPEPSGRHVVGAGDPALFSVLDTTNALQRSLFPPASPLVANMRVDVSVSVRRNTWVRNREANVEIYTDAPLAVHDEQQAFSITGVVTTERGEYNFMSKRFQIQRGSAMFIGSPDLNPTLQVTGEYQVQVAARGALNIRVLIGGTLHHPTLSLESDAQPPKTQSELLSLLAFGQSTTSLMASTSSSIAGSAATMDLFGVGAQMAVRRLAGVALGVAVDQVQIQAGRAFGTDVFDITPADVPQVSSQGIGNFFTQTKFEAGKYINGRTYVSAQEQAGAFGAAIDHRTSDGWRFTASFEPRIVLLEPHLRDQPYTTRTAIGGFVLKEWRW